jgi:hypothetical protein
MEKEASGSAGPSGCPSRQERTIVLLEAHNHVEPFDMILLRFLDCQIDSSALLARR